MPNPFKEKLIKDNKEPEYQKIRKMDLLAGVEEVEIGKLEPEDADEVHKVMRKALWECAKEEVLGVINYGMSYGAYVERMLVGAGLAWAVHYDEARGEISSGEPNAVFMEDVALLLAYEGKGIRKMLIEEREKEGKSRGFTYAIAYISPDWNEGDIGAQIMETGNRMERAYLSCGYSFKRAKNGVLAVKRL